MKDKITAITATPFEVGFGNETFKFAPLDLYGLGELYDWVSNQIDSNRFSRVAEHVSKLPKHLQFAVVQDASKPLPSEDLLTWAVGNPPGWAKILSMSLKRAGYDDKDIKPIVDKIMKTNDLKAVGLVCLRIIREDLADEVLGELNKDEQERTLPDPFVNPSNGT